MDEDGVMVVNDPDDSWRFVCARDGNNLVTSFQCDLCHFRNLMKRDPITNLAQDLRLLKLIRRANLDALWSREPGTVYNTLLSSRQGARIAASLNFAGMLFRPMGPFPLDDTFGMGAAIVMLQISLQPGRYDKHVQFSTVRKFRSGFSNVYQASAEGQAAMVMAKDMRKLTVTKCPTYCEFFERFMRGMHKRMGEIVRPDHALSLEVLLQIFKTLELEWTDPHIDWFSLAMEGAFYLIAFCCALHGEEVPLTDLYGVSAHWEAGQTNPTKHVVVALLGRFKGETGESYHVMPLVDVTDRGLEPRKWIGRLLMLYENNGTRHGPFFRHPDGTRRKAGTFENKFFERLEHVKTTHPHLLASIEDISEEFGISRSFWRGATSEAVNAGVPPDVIDANNRWRRVHQAGAKAPSMTMREHYTDVRLTLNHRLRFSKAL